MTKTKYSILTGAFTALAFISPANAQNTETDAETPTLETYVVTPTRFPAEPNEIGNAITVIPGTELEARQIKRVEDALRHAPGVIFATTGQSGSATAVQVRGVNSNQTQVVVDGIRVNDANISSQTFLGGARAHHLQRIEVLRGPQSALYGGEAIGGVINILTPRGSGEPTTAFDVTGGSFSTLQTNVSNSGEDGPLAWSFSAGHDATENDRANNEFTNSYWAGRIDYALSESASLGFTFRGADREYGSAGSIFDNDPNNTDEDLFLLFTTFIDYEISDRLSGHFVAGYFDQRLKFLTPPDTAQNSQIDNEKWVLDSRHTYEWDGGHTSLLGFGYEDSSVSNVGGFGNQIDSDSLFSVYSQQQQQLAESLSATGGVRWEEYDSFGDALTWRGAAAYELEATGTTFRASVGSGFRAPSFFELFASSAFFAGNPNLDPEESLGWDVGIEQKIGDVGVIAVTYFENDLTDLIVTDFSGPILSVANAAEAETSGFELEFAGELPKGVHYSLAYTFLDADNLTTGTRLLRRPRHTVAFDVHTTFGEKLTIGAGAYWLDDRLDLDPAVFTTIPGDDYIVARFYGNLKISERLDLHVRIENAFDEEYDEVAGFPGRGFGVFGGFRYQF
jgi:vitamin B12 transporter